MKGSQLLEIRKNLGLSQAAFSSELGVSRTFLSLMERNLKPISRRTELSALHLQGDAAEPVNQVNNVKRVNNSECLDLACTIMNILTKFMVETNKTIEPYLLRSNSKEVRKLCIELSNLHESEFEGFRNYLNGLSDKDVSSKFISHFDFVVKFQRQRYEHSIYKIQKGK